MVLVLCNGNLGEWKTVFLCVSPPSLLPAFLRAKLTSDAEKQSVMMFGQNLHQLLLRSPVPGRTLMGVDPGYKHGCKLAIISPTSKASALTRRVLPGPEFHFKDFLDIWKKCLFLRLRHGFPMGLWESEYLSYFWIRTPTERPSFIPLPVCQWRENLSAN